MRSMLGLADGHESAAKKATATAETKGHPPPKLDRTIQSKRLLEQGDHNEEAMRSQKQSKKDPAKSEKMREEPAKEKSTAAKSRVTKPAECQPPAPQAKLERSRSEIATADAVDACLNRQSTEELVGGAAKITPAPKTKPAVPEKKSEKEKDKDEDTDPSNDTDEETDDDDDADERLEKALQKKRAHARYMRFSRSLKSASAI